MQQSKSINKLIILLTCFVLLIIILIAIFITSTEPIATDYEVVSTESYTRSGKQCIGYRVYVDAREATTKQYKAIFNKLVKSDDYYLHTVWFYFLKSSANGSSSADVIMEEMKPGVTPTPSVQ